MNTREIEVVTKQFNGLIAVGGYAKLHWIDPAGSHFVINRIGSRSDEENDCAYFEYPGGYIALDNAEIHDIAIVIRLRRRNYD